MDSSSALSRFDPIPSSHQSNRDLSACSPSLTRGRAVPGTALPWVWQPGQTLSAPRRSSTLPPPRSPRGLRLGLLQQRVDGLLQLIAADVAVADHALAVEHEDGGDPADVPVLHERRLRPAGPGPPVRPGELLLGQEVLERLDLVVDARAHQPERLALQPADHLALVGDHRRAW